MINFIVGSACTGKTYTTIKRVALESQKGKVFLIVPEQFSFETERAVIKLSDANIDNIKILSFSRLLDDAYETMGRGRVNCISDFEKIVLTKRALLAVSDKLSVFSRFTNYKDFPQNLYKTIRDLKMSGISEVELLNTAEIIGGSCGAKLKEISLVMSAYNALLDERFIDSADSLTKLADILNDVKLFAESHVFFDSFTGFTGQQFKVISKIMSQADDVTFSFSTNEPENLELGLFYNINNAIEKIKSIARSRGINSFNTFKLTKRHYSNDGMRSIERLMSDDYNGESFLSNGNVDVIACENKRAEALAAATIIRKEVAKNGYRFKDFIVVARNAKDYAAYIDKQCKNNNIACFMDKHVILTDTPLGIYISTLLQTVSLPTTENILRLLKLKLNSLSEDELSSLEDYVYIWDIKGSDWSNDWDMSLKGLEADFESEQNLKRLSDINTSRQQIYDMLNNFRTKFKGCATNRATALYNHLIECKIDKHLEELCDRFKENGDSAYSSLLKQSWDYVISVLDSVVRALPDSEITAEEFADAFEIAAAEAKISNIPQMLDEVTFGAADRIRPSKPKISIILGANQGIFPQISDDTGILSRSDKEKLNTFGILLDDDALKGAVEENFLVYSMLCCPVDKVYVLYSRRNDNYDELEPSAFVSKILAGFDDVSLKNFELSSYGEFVPQTEKAAFSELGGIKGRSFYEIKAALSDNQDYKGRLDMLGSDTFKASFNIDSEISAGLFGDKIHMSATKFDTYHRCSLSYFLKSGLRAKKLERAELNVLQRGTITHYVLENLINKHHEKLADCSNMQISAETDALISEYFSHIKGADKLKTSRFLYLLEKISSSVKQIALHIADELRQSEFVPKYCELTIGENSDVPQLVIALDDGAKVVLDGKIDRVDVYKNNIRVVDYKTGKMTFELSDTLLGLNMQMLLYLYTFVKNGSHLVDSPKPAGILYMPAKVSADTKSLKMNGLISKDEDVRFAMEKENKGVYVPKYTEKSNEYADGELFELVFSKIDSLMKKMGEEIRKGNFSANPTDSINMDACAYCDFASVCRSSDIKHNCAQKYNNSQILEILREGETNGI